MHTGFDILESSKDLRHHWARRFAAGSIDMLIIFVPFYMVLYYFDLPYKTIITGVGAGLIWFIYSGYFEGRYGRTLGKLLVHLKVVSMRERRLYHQTFVRSIPKLFWYIFLPFDVVIGLATEGDPRKRWTDGIARTLVIAYYPAVPRSKKVPGPRSRVKQFDDAKLQ